MSRCRRNSSTSDPSAPATSRTGRRVGIGMIFLPRTDFGAQERCRTIVETEILRFGFYIFGWRQVPVDIQRDRRKGERDAPRDRADHVRHSRRASTMNELERRLYLVRRRIEKQVRANSISDFYVCSLSARSIIYKGMFLAEQLDNFYPDLKDERFVSSMAIYHQRYSTNTFPKWWLAQPFRMLAHNGEINTIKGNMNWMKSHEIRMAARPVRRAWRRDQAGDPAGCERYRRARCGIRSAGARRPQCADGQDHAHPRGVVEDGQRPCPRSHRAMYAYANAVMEPWDGPAASARDRRALGDRRHGPQRLAPAALHDPRQTILLIVGSETGMVRVDEARVRREGPRRPRVRCSPSI